jgi:hypothetical protein
MMRRGMQAAAAAALASLMACAGPSPRADGGATVALTADQALLVLAVLDCAETVTPSDPRAKVEAQAYACGQQLLAAAPLSDADRLLVTRAADCAAAAAGGPKGVRRGAVIACVRVLLKATAAAGA